MELSWVSSQGLGNRFYKFGSFVILHMASKPSIDLDYRAATAG